MDMISPVSAKIAIAPSQPIRWSEREGVISSSSLSNILLIKRPLPATKNTHPQESVCISIPEVLRTSPFQVFRKRYPISPSTIRQKNFANFQDRTASKIQMIARQIKMMYAGIWRSVSGKGELRLLLLTTGDIIPVKTPTTPSIPRCIRERVI